jgi:ATP-binding cassette subfamily B protein
MIPAWPSERLGEALEALARKSGLPVKDGEMPRPAATLALYPGMQGKWIEATAAWLGLEVEETEIPYPDLERNLRTAGPALLRLPDGSFAAILDNGNLLAPDLSAKRLKSGILSAQLASAIETPLILEVDEFLAHAEVLPRRRSKARASILRERLRDARLGPVWSVRMPPGASAWAVAHRAGLPSRIALLIGAHAAEYVLWIVSWWLVGQGALQGRFDAGWLMAWALLLFTMVPLRALTARLQGVVALTAGGLLKERLLMGAFRLESDEVRRQGVGHLLGRVLESEALESLALSGGFLALVAAIELAVAAVVLFAGAGGALHAALLVLWVALTLVLAWRYYSANCQWTSGRLHMTHDLVERMDGHRTRLAQELRAHWHHHEDEALERYLHSGRAMDGSAAWLAALAPRGWLIVGLLGLAPAFVSGTGAPAGLAIGIGGMLLAWRALKGLTNGLWNLAGAAIAWKLVEPLIRAASRPQSHGIPALAGGAASPPNETIIDAQNIFFRYQGRAEAVLRGCNLRVDSGDRLVLDGPSGSGKSTLSSLLAGLREPDSGLLLAGGLDRRTLGADRWRKVVACAPQFHENHVLCGPFAFNLLMGRPGQLGESDVEEAEAICRELGLGDLLARMPAGIMQMVGETGWQLSHGERGRLFMARALLQQSEVIVLDESFAALDPENLRLALNCVCKRARAALVIAHR